MSVSTHGKTIVDVKEDAGLRQPLALPPGDPGDGAGATLAGAGPRFTPVRPLGAGGMGEVFLVEDRDIHRQVALKRLKPGAEDSEVVVRFIDEIRTVGQLDHPGVAPIHDVGLDEQGRYYFIMKYVQGETLEAVIAGLKGGDEGYRRRFSFETRARVFLQLLRVVQFAHSKGILHRDLKPANVMVGPYGEVLLIDWGLARRMGPRGQAPPAGPPPGRGAQGPGAAELARLAAGPGRATETRRGALVGTPLYMSPEQIQGPGDALDERSDVYSLCALFYELLTLEHYLPPKDSIQSLLGAVLFEAPPSAIAIHHRFAVPPELAHFVRKGLEKDPAARYQSVGEMIDRLQAIADGEIPVQCPCTSIKRAGGGFSHFIDRHPFLAILACLVAAALVAYGAVRLAGDLAALLR